MRPSWRAWRAKGLAAALAFALALGMDPAAGAEPPGTARSRAAEARAAPDLAPGLAAAGVALGAPVYLRITKTPGVLELWMAGAGGAYALVRAYPVCAMSGGLGPKRREGDLQAPEGFYRVAPGQMNPASAFHLSFNLGYPNAFDRAHGRTGAYLMVHGGCASIGCFAMTDAAIAEIWTAMAAAFRSGQGAVPVHVFPFPLTADALAAQADHPEAAFWAELAPAWSLFEQKRRPPEVQVRGRRYVVAGAPMPASATTPSASD